MLPPASDLHIFMHVVYQYFFFSQGMSLGIENKEIMDAFELDMKQNIKREVSKSYENDL